MSDLVRILIVDDQLLIREGLRGLLELQPDFNVVGQAATCAEAVRMARQIKFDVILLDLDLPDGNGIEALQAILEHNPRARIIILTGLMEKEMVVQAMRQGAAGYMLKTASIADLVSGIRAAYHNGSPLHTQVATILIHEFNQPTAKKTPIHDLTQREVEILHLLAQGCSNHTIARELSISPYTVSAHVGHILKKLNLTNRTQAALFGQKLLSESSNKSNEKRSVVNDH